MVGTLLVDVRARQVGHEQPIPAFASERHTQRNLVLYHRMRNGINADGWMLLDFSITDRKRSALPLGGSNI